MKTYWKMTEYDRACLAEEDLARLMDIECMENGVAPPQPADIVDVASVDVPSEECWAVKWGWSDKLYFKTEREANDFVALGGMGLTQCKGAPDKYCSLTPLDFEVSRKPCYDPDKLADVSGALKAIEDAQSHNAVERKRFAGEVKAYDDCTQKLRRDWVACQAAKRAYEAMLVLFEEYVKLCDGDRDKALAFLRKAKGSERVDSALEWHPKWQSLGLLEKVANRMTRPEVAPVPEVCAGIPDNETPF